MRNGCNLSEKWCFNTETTTASVVQHMPVSFRLHCHHQVLQNHFMFGCLDRTHIIGDVVVQISRTVSTVYRNTSGMQPLQTLSTTGSAENGHDALFVVLLH